MFTGPKKKNCHAYLNCPISRSVSVTYCYGFITFHCHCRWLSLLLSLSLLLLLLLILVVLVVVVFIAVAVVVIEVNVRFPHLSNCLRLYLTLWRIWNQWCLRDIGHTFLAFNAHEKCRYYCHSNLLEFSCWWWLLSNVDCWSFFQSRRLGLNTPLCSCVCICVWGDWSIFHPFQPAH